MMFTTQSNQWGWSSASLAFVRGIHRSLWPVNSPHKGPVMRNLFPFDDVIMPILTQECSKKAIDQRTYEWVYWTLSVIELQSCSIMFSHSYSCLLTILYDRTFEVHLGTIHPENTGNRSYDVVFYPKYLNLSSFGIYPKHFLKGAEIDIKRISFKSMFYAPIWDSGPITVCSDYQNLANLLFLCFWKSIWWNIA